MIKQKSEAKSRAELKELGCPYELEDSRARIWLDGYQACIKADMKMLAE